MQWITVKRRQSSWRPTAAVLRSFQDEQTGFDLNLKTHTSKQKQNAGQDSFTMRWERTLEYVPAYLPFTCTRFNTVAVFLEAVFCASHLTVTDLSGWSNVHLNHVAPHALTVHRRQVATGWQTLGGTHKLVLFCDFYRVGAFDLDIWWTGWNKDSEDRSRDHKFELDVIQKYKW